MMQARKFINRLMSDGKRRRAERIFNAAFEMVRLKICGAVTPGEILNGSIESARPHFVIQRRRIGGVQYEVPVPVPEKRNRAFAIRAIIEGALDLPGRGMAGRLAQAILAAYRNESV